MIQVNDEKHCKIPPKRRNSWAMTYIKVHGGQHWRTVMASADKKRAQSSQQAAGAPHLQGPTEHLVGSGRMPKEVLWEQRITLTPDVLKARRREG